MFKLNVLITIVALFFIVLMSHNANAANDLEKWNSQSGKVARSAMKEKLSTTTYRELPNHVDSSYRSTANGGKVLRELETSAEIKGSRVGATINALKEVDKFAAAKKWGAELGKGAVRFGVAGILIDQAMQEMLDGIGWIIDEGGKVTKKPVYEEGACSPTMQKCWLGAGKYYSSALAAASGIMKYHNEKPVNQGTSEQAVRYVYTQSNGNVELYNNSGSKVGNFTTALLINPNYSSTAQPEDTSLSDAEMIEKIRDYFENPQSPPSKDLLIEDAVKPKGKAKIAWSDDPSSEQTIYSDNKTTAEKVLNSDNPVADGLTKDTPKISDGTTVESETTTNTETNTNVNENTVTNPDGSTTTSGTNTSTTTNTTINKFELPAFCNYAAKLCDWLDWTKEEPELEGEKLDIEEQDITDYKYQDHVDWGSQCPFFEKTENLDFEIGIVKVKYNLDFFCDFGRKAKSTIVGLGHFGALIFLIIGIRSGSSG